ncbi:hypothetical protein FM037_17300 [Shewanella psychropiezotolerans]|uniref:Uncharacterized protein n=1 Tax=Shewanella psychropiezotolerans TaxID=2593655 RepID=A0ABX5WZX1_9GAMM|nr:hypothetical protein [Shewanella psychropiezotolerans]QDO84650.1 hypothetical protein FM037_17300 [Shewanella psychropiezotolerans]
MPTISVTPSSHKTIEISSSGNRDIVSKKGLIKSAKAASAKLASIGSALTLPTCKDMHFNRAKATQKSAPQHDVTDFKSEFIPRRSEAKKHTAQDTETSTTALQNYYQHQHATVKQEFESLFNTYASSSTEHGKYAQSYANDLSMTCVEGRYQLPALPKTVAEFAIIFNQLAQNHAPNGSLGKLIKKALGKNTTLGQLLDINTSAKLGALSQLIPITLKVTLKHKLSSPTTTEPPKVIKLDPIEKEKLATEKQRKLPSLLQQLDTLSEVYSSYVKELPTADSQARGLQQSLLEAANKLDAIDKDNELQRQPEFRGRGATFTQTTPNTHLAHSALFDSDKIYSLADFDDIIASNRAIKEKIAEFDRHLSQLNQNIGFHVEKLPNKAEVANSKILGINPLDIDLDKVMDKLNNLETLLLKPKQNWRSRLINFFHPKGFQSESDRLTFETMAIHRLKELKEKISTSSVEMKLEDFSTKPWFKYLVAKQIESLQTASQSYQFGPFSIASPAKKQLDAFLRSNDWPKPNVA